jgi:lipopolysaccharide transport system permease protein
VRYQDTVLGLLWSLMKPLALAGVYYAVFRYLVDLEIEDYHLVLMAALFPWIWFQSSVLLGTPAFATNGPLLKKVPFPRYVLPFATVLNYGVHFALSIPIFIILLVASGNHPDATWLLGIPILVGIQVVLLMGIILILASIDVFFRDLEHFVEVLLNIAFYATPILYPLDRVPDKWHNLLLINPLTSLMEAWRELLIDNSLPGVDLWPVLLFASAAILIGSQTFRRLEPGFADAL